MLTSRRGSAAVQFALAAPVFLLLLCAVIENGIILFSQSLLDEATRDAARLIQTGQVQQGGGVAAFSAQLCTDLGSYIPCGSLQYNVQSGSSFASLNVTITTNSSGNMTNTGFDPGNPQDDVAVQVGYNRSFIIPWLGNVIGTTGGTLLVSTVIFQNEPFIP